MVSFLWVAGCFHEDDGGGEGTSQPTTSQGSTSTAGTGVDSSDTTSMASTITEASGEVSTVTDGTTGESSCGDGNVDDGEDCDDGNQLPGDGCSMCRSSGTVRWLVPFGASGRADTCRGVVVGTDIFAAGALADAAGLQHGWAVRIDAQGETVWRYDHEDTLASIFNGIDLLTPERPIAVGQRNIANPALSDAWARRFDAAGNTGTEDELVWHLTNAQTGFSSVTTLGTTLGLSATTIDGVAGFQAWFGELAIGTYPSTAFAPTAIFGSDKALALGLAGDGAGPTWRGLYRDVEAAGPDPLTMIAFAGDVDQSMNMALALPGSDEPVAVAVDGAGSTLTCMTDPATQGIRIDRWSPSLTPSDPVVLTGGLSRCTSLVPLPGGGVIYAGSVDGIPFAAELDDAFAPTWSLALDEYEGSVRAVDVGPLASSVALCGTLDETVPASTDAFVALLSR